MSKITITPNGTGTGTFSIASPNSDTSHTLTLPDSTGELLNAESSLNATKLTGNIAASQLTGALPAISGASLTGIETASFKNTYIGGATYVVTVASVLGVNKYHIAGVANPTLSFFKGNAYVFDLSDSTNTGHPLRFKNAAGTSYSTGVVVTGTPGQAGAKVTITVAASAPVALRYYCTVHGNAMGNTIAVAVGGVLDVGTFNFFDHGSLRANNAVSFTSVPTNANWRYSYINNFISNSYDLTTGLYSGQALETIGNQDSDPGGLAFKPDGTKMYITGFQNDSIYEYDLSKAWDVSTAVYLQLFSGFGLQTTRPEGIFFKPDGLVLYMVGSMNPDSVYSYNLSTAWNVTTAVYNNTLDLSSRETSLRDIHFKSDGTAFYVLGSTSDRVEEYTMSTAWNVATGTYSGQSHYVGGVDGSPNGLFINPTGTELFVCGAGGDRVYQYTLSTAFLFSSATLTKSFDVTSQSTEPQAVTFDPDGYSMFLLSNVPTAVHSYQVGLGVAITLPSSVVGQPTKAGNGDRVTYEFFTSDGGTTVNLIAEEKV